MAYCPSQIQLCKKGSGRSEVITQQREFDIRAFTKDPYSECSGGIELRNKDQESKLEMRFEAFSFEGPMLSFHFLIPYFFFFCVIEFFIIYSPRKWYVHRNEVQGLRSYFSPVLF